jgi:hypothetical protein
LNGATTLLLRVVLARAGAWAEADSGAAASRAALPSAANVILLTVKTIPLD